MYVNPFLLGFLGGCFAMLALFVILSVKITKKKNKDKEEKSE